MRYTQSVLIDYCATYKFNSNFNKDKSFHYNELKKRFFILYVYSSI